jgi:hypothetical protein
MQVLKRRFAFAAFATCVACGPARAEVTAEANFAEAVKICGIALMQPDQLAKAWLDAGFALGPAQSISPNWTGTGFTRDSTTIAMTDLKFSDTETVTCQYTTTSLPATLQDVKSFVGKFANDPLLGPMEVEIGEVPIGSEKKMILGAMHRTGKDPMIGGSLNLRDNFLLISFSRTKAN